MILRPRGYLWLVAILDKKTLSKVYFIGVEWLKKVMAPILGPEVDLISSLASDVSREVPFSIVTFPAEKTGD